jgi:hypothetical protein
MLLNNKIVCLRILCKMVGIHTIQQDWLTYYNDFQYATLTETNCFSLNEMWYHACVEHYLLHFIIVPSLTDLLFRVSSWERSHHFIQTFSYDFFNCNSIMQSKEMSKEYIKHVTFDLYKNMTYILIWNIASNICCTCKRLVFKFIIIALEQSFAGSFVLYLKTLIYVCCKPYFINWLRVIFIIHNWASIKCIQSFPHNKCTVLQRVL